MKTTINQIPRKIGASFTGDFRVRSVHSFFDVNARPYFAMTLCDATGEIPGFCWSQGNCCRLVEFEAVTIEGRVRNYNGRWQADICEVVPLGKELEPLANAVQLLPLSKCPQPEALERLPQIIGAIRNTSLQAFVNLVLGDRDIALKFLRASASEGHHHAEPGGLMLHSVECAEYILRQYPTPSDMRDLGVVGALFHDIGKVRTCKALSRGSSLPALVHHDALTLEILALPLRMLDTCWAGGAETLRYCWTWMSHPQRRRYPVIGIAEMIRAADRQSVIDDVHKRAFYNATNWRQFVNYGASGPKTLCWRPKAY